MFGELKTGTRKLVFASAMGMILLATDTLAESDDRFFGTYCGAHSEEITVTFRFLGMALWSDTHTLEFEANLKLDHFEPRIGDGFVMGSGTVIATDVPETFRDHIDQDEQTAVGLSAAVVARGRLEGSGIVFGRGSGTGTAFLSSDGERLTISSADRSITVSKADCNNAQPTAQILEPSAGTLRWGDQVTFKATASDPEDGSLPDDRVVWRSDRDGLLGTGHEVTRPRLGLLSPGQHTITLTATDSGGRAARSVVELSIENNVPTVEIISPSANENVFEGQLVTLRGRATDRETGLLDGTALRWLIDGEPMGHGNLRSVQLPAGRHDIRLVATDSNGGEAEDNRTIEVLAKPANVPPSITIRSPHMYEGIGDDPTDCLDLIADASDADGDPLTITWLDKPDGGSWSNLGTGREMAACGLSAGAHDTWHEISASVSDGINPPSIDSVRIFVVTGGLI